MSPFAFVVVVVSCMCPSPACLTVCSPVLSLLLILSLVFLVLSHVEIASVSLLALESKSYILH